MADRPYARRTLHQLLGDDVNLLTPEHVAAYATTDLAELGRLHADARRRAATVGRVLKAGLRAAVEDGMSEAEAARQAGVSRETVRAALGKG